MADDEVGKVRAGLVVHISGEALALSTLRTLVAVASARSVSFKNITVFHCF